MRKLFRLIALAAVVAAIVWLTRERLLPPPRVGEDPRPPYRSTPPPPPHQEPDDLTEIKGIGPVFAARLAQAGIRSFRGLSEIDPVTIAATVGTTETNVAGWIDQARARLS